MTAHLRAIARYLPCAGVLCAIASVATAQTTATDAGTRWRQANEQVQRLGGWRVYSRETAAPSDSPDCMNTAGSGDKGEVLDELAALRLALAPRQWPPRVLQEAEGSARRVAVDPELINDAAAVRHAWLEAVTAKAQLANASRLFTSFDAAADLAERMHQAGNLSTMHLARQRLAKAQAGIACLEARQGAEAAQGALWRRMNLAGKDTGRVRLPERLPALPAQLPDSAAVARGANRALQNLDNPADAVRLGELESRWRTVWEVARRYHDQVLVHTRLIQEESVLQYNGMLIGPAELLENAREHLNAETAAIEAQRAFWAADIALQSAMMGQLTLGDH